MTHQALDRLRVDFADLGDLLEARGGIQQTDLSRFRHDILGFVAFLWPHVILTAAQRAHLVAVQDHTRVAAYGANGCGKSFDDALVACWAIWCWDALVIATSAKESQLTDQYMRDVRRLFASTDLLWGEMRVLGIRRLDNPDSGLLCMAAGSEHNLRSYHAKRIMVQLHEGQGLPAFAYESAEIMAIGEWDRVTVTGNPVDPSGPFHKRCTSPHWHPIRFDAREHLNIVEGRTVIAGGPTRESFVQRARDYGEGSAFYISSVWGEFPSESSEALVRRGWLETSQARWRASRGAGTEPQSVLGVDVAALGGDRSVVAVRCGRTITEVRMLPVSDTMTTVEAIIAMARELGLCIHLNTPLLSGHAYQRPPFSLVRVDAVGIGAGVADRLVELGINCERFTGSGAVRYNRTVCLNARADAFWSVRMVLERGELDLPPDDALIEELLGIRCHPNPATGLMQIIDKDVFRGEHKGRSPDRADAVSLAVVGMYEAAGATWTTFDMNEVLGI